MANITLNEEFIKQNTEIRTEKIIKEQDFWFFDNVHYTIVPEYAKMYDMELNEKCILNYLNNGRSDSLLASEVKILSVCQSIYEVEITFIPVISGILNKFLKTDNEIYDSTALKYLKYVFNNSSIKKITRATWLKDKPKNMFYKYYKTLCQYDEFFTFKINNFTIRVRKDKYSNLSFYTKIN